MAVQWGSLPKVISFSTCKVDFMAFMWQYKVSKQNPIETMKRRNQTCGKGCPDPAHCWFPGSEMPVNYFTFAVFSLILERWTVSASCASLAICVTFFQVSLCHLLNHWDTKWGHVLLPKVSAVVLIYAENVLLETPKRETWATRKAAANRPFAKSCLYTDGQSGKHILALMPWLLETDIW